MKLIVHRLAQSEFERKILWLKHHGYLHNAAELFYTEIEQTLRTLLQLKNHRKITGAKGYYRVGPTATFRYSVIYELIGDAIHVLAIKAPERHPNYWKRRRS